MTGVGFTWGCTSPALARCGAAGWVQFFMTEYKHIKDNEIRIHCSNLSTLKYSNMATKLYMSLLATTLIRKYKTFSVLIYSYINTSGNWKNEKLCGNTTPAGRSVFTQFRVFPIFSSVDITVYQYGKNVLYFFYDIAQRTLTEEWREIFRVINTGLSQSAFRIYKCCIIKLYIIQLKAAFHFRVFHTHVYARSSRPAESDYGIIFYVCKV